jgi:hypothetical protein
MGRRRFKDEMEWGLGLASQDAYFAEAVMEYFCGVVEKGNVPDRRVLDAA